MLESYLDGSLIEGLKKRTEKTLREFVRRSALRRSGGARFSAGATGRRDERVQGTSCASEARSEAAGLRHVAELDSQPISPSARPRSADVPTILSLIRDLAEYERAPNEVVRDRRAAAGRFFSAHNRRPKCLLGEENGEPVCFALFFHNFSTWMGRRGLYLEDLFVRPEVRGKGYGRALLVRLAQIAQERDCGRMEWAVLDWNEPAIQFYRKLGARPNEEWTIFRLTRDGSRNSPRTPDR